MSIRSVGSENRAELGKIVVGIENLSKIPFRAKTRRRDPGKKIKSEWGGFKQGTDNIA